MFLPANGGAVKAAKITGSLEYNRCMSSQPYPDYIQRMLAEAERLLADEDDPGPCEAAAIGFDILALFPEHEAARALIWRAFRFPRLIQDNRRALSRTIDEWDDRPWQHRRRLALSFRYMSRWEGWDREYEEGFDEEREGPLDVRKYLQEGHGQLLADYLGGQAQGAEGAWQIFQEAIRLTNNPRLAMLWVGKQYALEGYFAESADVLGDLLHRFPSDQDARRLLAEVSWWRDNQDRIPWIPPAGDGSRFRRTLQRENPEELAAWESSESVLNQYRPPDPANLPPTMDSVAHVPPEIEQKLELPLEETTQAAEDSLVDWSYLDRMERREIDESKFPRWARDLLDDLSDEPEIREDMKRMLAEQFANKALYPDEYFEEDDDEDDEQGWEFDETAEDDDPPF